MSQERIIKLALKLLGENPGTSALSDKNIALGLDAFDFVLREILSKNLWSFAKKEIKLQKENIEPLNPNYKYIYLLPNDWQATIKVYPESKFIFSGKTILSNEKSLTLEYVYLPTVDDLPDYFITLLTYAIANFLSILVKQDVTYKEIFKREYESAFGVAVFMDKQGQTNGTLAMPAIITARME